MFRFRQYLTEVELWHDFTRRSPIVTRDYPHQEDSPTQGKLYDGDTHGKTSNPVKYHSTLPSGHVLYTRQFDAKSGNAIHSLQQAKHNGVDVGRDYYAVDPKTSLVHVKIYGQHVHENKNKTITMTPHVSARPGTSLKTHEVYHHLITQHNHILHTGIQQSPGGKHVWTQLSKMPDVNVFGYKTQSRDQKRFKTLNVEPHREDEVDHIYSNPDKESEPSYSDKFKKPYTSVHHVTLVAHKKF